VPDLILDSLEIQNYRGLRELRIEHLGRVNLIVGKNNVGKSSLLEALRIYASRGSTELILQLLESRDQFDADSISGRRYSKTSFVLPLKSIFFMEGRDAFQTVGLPIIKVGRAGLQEALLSLSIDTQKEVTDQTTIHEDYLLIKFSAHEIRIPLRRIVADAQWTHQSEFLTDTKSWISCFHVGANGLNSFRLESLWNTIALTPLEDEVIEALRLIAAQVERLVFKPVHENSRIRVPFVKLKGVNDPLPLRSMGDGMNRVFGIDLALVNAKGGMLLIDEVENGLHYSVQPDIWRMIFESASKLNVQVFATTHSLDCVRAFETAARESPEEGVLVRLAQKAGRILVGEFDEDDLKIAVEGQIEVR